MGADMALEPAESTTSALGLALDRVGDRWSLLLVEALLPGPLRFNELLERVSGIAPNILTERLRRLGRSGVLLAQPYSRRPLRMAYRLTAEGEELAGVLRLLAAWGLTGDAPEALRHAACGTPLEARWYCPTCSRSVEDGEESALRFA
jgi:DNA-binding HxlR family transcriptional regulator